MTTSRKATQVRSRALCHALLLILLLAVIGTPALGHLQQAERASASGLLAEAMNAVRNESAQERITAKLAEFDTYVKEEAEAIDKVRTDLRTLEGKIADFSGSPETREALEKQRAELVTNVEAGALASRLKAEQEVKAIKTALAPPPQPDAFTAGASQDQRGDTAERAFTRYEMKIQFGGLAVKFLVYLFALLVGWAALYLSNPTFGARPEDYIALFLWGATVNFITGQQIKLENIYGHKAVQVNLAPQAGPAAGGGQAGGGQAGGG